MLQLFSTELLPASDRFDAWQWNAQKICGDCRFELLRSSFHGSIEVRQLGAVRLTRFASSPLSFWKRPMQPDIPENRSCIVITQIAGQRLYFQNGTEVLLRPGDSTVINAGRPWSSACATECARLYLRMPSWMMENRLHTREIPIARRIPGDSRTGAMLSRISQKLYEEAVHLQQHESEAALDAYFEMLGECLALRVATERPTETLGKILKYVEAHLNEATLGPAEVAGSLGISLRHLHRVFASTGNSMGEYVRVRRLEECRKDLMNPQHGEKSITDIAFSHGFSDAAHFSHSFRRQFGMSPRSVRNLSARQGRPSVRGFLRDEVTAVRALG
jgi:AraC family transcriptional activator of tynA and feaB